MDKVPFSELWRENTVIQALLAVIVTGAMVYMYMTGQNVPDMLVSVVSLILGFYFGAKNQNTVMKRLSNRENTIGNDPSQ